MKKIMYKEHNGYGGIYFMTISILCALLTIVILRLSWASQVIAMADNIAYITCINTAANSYTYNLESFDSTNPVLKSKSGDKYDPLKDFNSMMSSAGIKASAPTQCHVTWNKNTKKASLQIGTFKTSTFKMNITPHLQNSIIENQ